MSSRRKCSCKNHVLYCADSTIQRIITIEGKTIRRNIIDAFIQRGDLTPYSKYLCNICHEYGKANFGIQEPPTKKTKTDQVTSLTQCVDTIISALDSGILEDGDIIKLSKALGRSQNKLVFDDSSTISQQYKNDDFLKTLNLQGIKFIMYYDKR